jgi:hypothetical protein
MAKRTLVKIIVKTEAIARILEHIKTWNIGFNWDLKIIKWFFSLAIKKVQ